MCCMARPVHRKHAQAVASERMNTRRSAVLITPGFYCIAFKFLSFAQNTLVCQHSWQPGTVKSIAVACLGPWLARNTGHGHAFPLSRQGTPLHDHWLAGLQCPSHQQPLCLTCGSASGRASKMMSSTPMGAVVLSRTRPASGVTTETFIESMLCSQEVLGCKNGGVDMKRPKLLWVAPSIG
jgi:hypothetical protein